MFRRIAALVIVLCVVVSVGAMAAAKPAKVFLGGKAVIKFQSSLGKQTPVMRAKNAATKLNAYLKQGKYEEFNIVPKENSTGQYVVSAGKFAVAVVDAKSARAAGKSPRNLALSWAENIRLAIKEAKLNGTTGKLKATYR